MSIAHQTLDFFPDQCSGIHTRSKTRTLRLGDRTSDYAIGETILLTELGLPMVHVVIKRVQVKESIKFTAKDLKGTGFANLEEASIKLRSIYRLPQILPNQVFSIIDWKYLEAE